MKIGITGANGYIGEYLSKKFHQNKHQVIKYVKDSAKINGIFCKRNFNLSKSDTFIFEDLDILIHCAYDFRLKSWEDIKKINVEKTIELLNTARQQGVKRIFFLSSISSFENAKSYYGQAKHLVEKSITGHNVYIIKAGIVYGNRLGGIAQSLCNISKNTYLLPIPYSENTKLVLSDIEDIFLNIFNSINIKNTPHQVSMICTKANLTLIDVMRNLNKINNINDPLYLKLHPNIFYLILYFVENLSISSKISRDSLISLLNTNNKIHF